MFRCAPSAQKRAGLVPDGRAVTLVAVMAREAAAVVRAVRRLLRFAVIPSHQEEEPPPDGRSLLLGERSIHNEAAPGARLHPAAVRSQVKPTGIHSCWGATTGENRATCAPRRRPCADSKAEGGFAPSERRRLNSQAASAAEWGRFEFLSVLMSPLFLRRLPCIF